MIDALAVATIVAALAVALAASVEAARNRIPGRLLFAGLAVVAGIIVVQTVVAVVRLIGGTGPQDTEGVVTFVGYLLTAVATPIVGAVLGRMEPTRVGSVLVGVAGLVEAVLVVRLQQIWS